MQTGISKSVGRSGTNAKTDVTFIQTALNTYAKKHANNSFPLKVDGLCGNKTVQAIYNLQKNHVGISIPDARIDPNGKTLRHLTSSAPRHIATPKATNTVPISVPTPIGFMLNEAQVTYADDIPQNRRVVSAYAINVVKLALIESGMTHAVITSTLRTPQDQVEIMYKNADLNFAQQERLYGSAGDSVLAVFKANQKKNKDQTIKLMKEKIESLLDDGKRTSQHCVTLESFSSMNTFDIGCASTERAPGRFDKKALTKAFFALEKQGYIKKCIDETMLKNYCWHLEIVPNAKDINLYKIESLLIPSSSITRRYV
jgi:peptidoglycan hydrolase-like protein with peptidoglycan-binding domain